VEGGSGRALIVCGITVFPTGLVEPAVDRLSEMICGSCLDGEDVSPDSSPIMVPAWTEELYSYGYTSERRSAYCRWRSGSPEATVLENQTLWAVPDVSMV
jgi:hypothetical protein